MTKLDPPVTREMVLAYIKEMLAEHFDVDADNVKLESLLYDDLDIDSIDAVDMIVLLKNDTGKKINPEAFKEVRTVDDMVGAAYDLING
jgi:acyl carrier protein